MNYKYQDPTENGFRKIDLQTKDHNELFPHRRKKWIYRYEYYLKDNSFEMHQLMSFPAQVISVLLFPVELIGHGFFNIKSLLNQYKRQVFQQKKYGAFVSDVMHTNQKLDEIKNKLQ